MIRTVKLETLIINTRKKANLKFILKLGEQGKILTKQEQEDFLLGEMMDDEKIGKNVSKATILKKLRG